MSSVVTKRHALGLPAGSVRAAHVLILVAMVCLAILMPSATILPVPPYLIYLLLLGLGHFFAAHGHTIRAPGTDHSPLYMPAGCVRFLVLLALVGAIGWKFYSDPDLLKRQFDASIDELKNQPLLPLLVLGGFFVGVVGRAIVGRENPPHVLQDLEAWLSILAMVGLGAAAVIHLVINPSRENPIPLPHWEGFLAAVVSFYFGERS